MKALLSVVFLATTCHSESRWSSQYHTYTQSQVWREGEPTVEINRQINQQFGDILNLPLGNIFRDIQNFEDSSSKLLNKGNQHFQDVENKAKQIFQQWNQNSSPGNERQVSQQWRNNEPRNHANQEFNLPDAVRNEVNEEASNREAAASNQKPLEGAAVCYVNPCTQKIPVPNFRKPGRRLSEIKCLEYIWDIKYEEENNIKDEQCYTYIRNCTNSGPIGRGFVGGRLTEKGEFPHMGALGWRATEGGWIFKCGSSMISPKFLVSAAHCTKARRDPKIANQIPEIVRIGAKNLVVVKDSFYPKDLEIANIIPHPNYKAPKQYYDIALIELKVDLTFDERIRPACLWSRFDTNTVDSSVTGSGWGVTEVGGREITTELRAGDLDIINSEYCNQLLLPKCNRLWCGLQEHQMCAGKLAGGVDACQGDSGGPLQAKINLHSSIKGRMYYLLGVTSFGFGCARENTPGVYTRISSFVDWIEPIVWPNESA